MTYAVGGLIQASDLNNLVSTGTPNLNNIWSTGTGNSGYGQTALSTVSVGGVVTAAQWASLINTIATSATHQGTSISSVTAPSAGDLIQYISAIPTNLAAINTGRSNASLQGSTSATTATNGTTWTDYLTFTFTVAFANNNSARYFFNSGGQLLLNFSHPAGSGSSINQEINSLCSATGTICYSSPSSGSVTLGGTSYTGVTKIGGSSPGSTTVNTNNGFYSVYPSGSNTILTQYASSGYYYYYYGGTNLAITAAYNGSGTITFTCVIDQVPNGSTVSAGTASTLTVRPPSTNYLSNSWGTPTVGFTIARA